MSDRPPGLRARAPVAHHWFADRQSGVVIARYVTAAKVEYGSVREWSGLLGWDLHAAGADRRYPVVAGSAAGW